MNLNQNSLYIKPVLLNQKLNRLIMNVWFWASISFILVLSLLFHSGLKASTLVFTLILWGMIWLIIRRILKKTGLQLIPYSPFALVISLMTVVLLGISIVQIINRPPSLYWFSDSDIHTWRPALTQNLMAWGQSEPSIVLHPPIGAEKRESLTGPWQVSASLDKIFPGSEKIINLLITIPISNASAIVEERASNSNSYDQLTLTISAREKQEWIVLQKSTMAALAKKHIHTWHGITLTLNPNMTELRIALSSSGLAGDSARSTLWVSVADVKRGGALGNFNGVLKLNDFITSALLSWLLLVFAWNVGANMNARGYFSYSKHVYLTKSAIVLGITVCVVLLVPTVIWILSDYSPFGGDQSQYAEASLNLYREFKLSWQAWAKKMMYIIGFKPPGLSWFGQLFVIPGLYFESINDGLMLSIVVILLATLLLVYFSLWSISAGNHLVAMAGVLIMASAPLFIRVSHHFLVEPMQLFSVAWFVFIMCRAPDWDRWMILTNLSVAASIAMLAKASSPLYCFVPGMVSLAYVIWPNKVNYHRGITFFSVILASVFLLATVLWYLNNISMVTAHVAIASAGPVAEIWGVQDKFYNSLLFWLSTFRHAFFQPLVWFIWVGIVIFGSIVYLIRIVKPKDFIIISVLAAVAQICLTLTVFSLHANRSGRYLLPLLPYIAVIMSWALLQVKYRLVQILIVVLLAGAFIVSSLDSKLTVDHRGKEESIIQELVMRTCDNTLDANSSRINIIAIDPRMKGDWLAPAPANYVASRLSLESGNELLKSCRYGYIGDSFFGDTAYKAWESILRQLPGYIVIADPDIYPPSEQVINQALNPVNFSILYNQIKKSELYVYLGRLENDKGILIYKYKDYLVEGRRLSDHNKHRAAVDLLEKAASLQPENAEVWANLQLALLRSGDYEKSIKIGEKGLSLSPSHPYMLMNMGLSHQRSGDCYKSISFLKKAILHAPDEQFRIEALRMLNNIKSGISQDNYNYLHDEKMQGCGDDHMLKHQTGN